MAVRLVPVSVGPLTADNRGGLTIPSPIFIALTNGTSILAEIVVVSPSPVSRVIVRINRKIRIAELRFVADVFARMPNILLSPSARVVSETASTVRSVRMVILVAVLFPSRIPTVVLTNRAGDIVAPSSALQLLVPSSILIVNRLRQSSNPTPAPINLL